LSLAASPPSPTPPYRSPAWEGSSPPLELGFVVILYQYLSIYMII
jgi:hypothetical protein